MVNVRFIFHMHSPWCFCHAVFLNLCIYCRHFFIFSFQCSLCQLKLVLNLSHGAPAFTTWPELDLFTKHSGHKILITWTMSRVGCSPGQCVTLWGTDAPVCCSQQREQSSSEPSGTEKGESSAKNSEVRNHSFCVCVCVLLYLCGIFLFIWDCTLHQDTHCVFITSIHFGPI